MIDEYWIPRKTYSKLKYYCLQYPKWQYEYQNFDVHEKHPGIKKMETRRSFIDPTANVALLRTQYGEKIRLIEDCAKEASPNLAIYILHGVTQDLTYEYLKHQYKMRVSRDDWYLARKRFFWLLDQKLNHKEIERNRRNGSSFYIKCEENL